MRELHALMLSENPFPESSLKQYSFLFDKFRLITTGGHLQRCSAEELASEETLEFLVSRGFISVLNCPRAFFYEEYRTAFDYVREADPKLDEVMVYFDGSVIYDFMSRYYAATLSTDGYDVVPICREMQSHLLSLPLTSKTVRSESVLRIAIDMFPVPPPDCAWDDILNFKSDLSDEHWGFRRWLHSLATKPLSEAEIRDEIEWTLNEYRKAMELHHLKASQTFVDVFVISPLEIIENLIKFNWSRIAKGALQVQKRRIELMEAEMKAPGRECAYVFETVKRFGGA
jgi:hypothetical protein